MKKWIAIVILIIIALIVYNYIYQDHRDIGNEEAEFVFKASNFSAEFSINPKASESKYLNKTIEVDGTVTDSDKNSITLNNNIFCQFNTSLDNIERDKNIKIKGRVIGYDDLLNEIKLDQCIIIN